MHGISILTFNVNGTIKLVNKKEERFQSMVVFQIIQFEFEI